MTALAATIAGLEPVGDGWRTVVPDNWLQGRTAYGGWSSALALHVAMMSDVDLPPLRSAQVAFIGPLAGTITLRARRLRRGRNAAYVGVEIESEAGLGLSATFVFMTERASVVDHAIAATPAFPAPQPGDTVYPGVRGVAFTQNFEFLDRRDDSVGAAEWLRWARLVARDGLDPMVELVAIADCLPPAALKLVGGFAPVSSMTWLLNLTAPAPVTRDGWWLLRADTGYARGGSSSQPMAIWNADGTRIAEGLQSVAVFA